jgi:hypothetical protein
MLGNPLVVPAFPQYLSGFVQALESVPTLAPFVVETMSKAFARLPDRVLLPWLPTLITTLRNQAGELVPVLVREAGRTFPGTLSAVDAWVPPWTGRAAPAKPATAVAVAAGPVVELLVGQPATCDAVAQLLGCDGEWRPVGGVPAGSEHGEVSGLLAEHPATVEAVAGLLDPATAG